MSSRTHGTTAYGTATPYPLPVMQVGAQRKQPVVLRTLGAWRGLPHPLEHILDCGLLPWLWTLLGHNAMPVVQAEFATRGLVSLSIR
jgi:hypothetical protein